MRDAILVTAVGMVRAVKSVAPATTERSVRSLINASWVTVLGRYVRPRGRYIRPRKDLGPLVVRTTNAARANAARMPTRSECAPLEMMSSIAAPIINANQDTVLGTEMEINFVPR